MKFKNSLSIILMILIIAILPLTAFAEGDTAPFTMTLECKIGGVVPADTKFTFGVTEQTLTIANGFDVQRGEKTDLADFTVDTKTATDGKLNFNFPEKAFSGGWSYALKLKSVSNSLADITPIIIEVDFKMAEGELAVEGRVLPDGNTDIPVQAFGDEPTALISIDCPKLPEVKISTEGCEAISKVYDGKLDAVITDKSYKLTGLDEAHNVKLSFNKAEYNSADVKTATKVTLSGLKLIGDDAAKYALASDTIVLNASITPRPITVTADSLVMTLGDTEPKLTYSLSEELIPGNTFTGELERQSGLTIGSYAITKGTLALSDNYEMTFVDGQLKISSFGFYQVLDRNTSVKIAGHFSPNEKVTAAALDPNGEAYLTLAASAGWGKILSSFDVNFTSTDFDGNLTVYLPVDPNLNGKEITVYQLTSGGGIVCFKPTAAGGYAAVQTSECSQFMLVTEKEPEKKESGSIAWTILKTIIIILAVIIGIGLVIALFFFAMIFFNKTEELKKLIKAIKKILKK